MKKTLKPLKTGRMEVLCLLLLQFLAQVKESSTIDCPTPRCPTCDGPVKKVKFLTCDDISCIRGDVTKICPIPLCPLECRSSIDKQVGNVQADGCCKCTCKGESPSTGGPILPPTNILCPNNCKYGLTEIVTVNGAQKCICQFPCLPSTCPPPGVCMGGTEIVQVDGCKKCKCSCKPSRCPTNCDYGTESTDLFGCKQCVCCQKPKCPNNCQHGTKYDEVAGRCNKCTCCSQPKCSGGCRKGTVTYGDDGCKKCDCCEKAICPRNCKDGTEMIDEDGCQVCVCKFINKCDPTKGVCCPAIKAPCKSPCEISEKSNGCLYCKCGDEDDDDDDDDDDKDAKKKVCLKSCPRFKKKDGKPICECCSKTNPCESRCKTVYDSYDCPSCECPKCPVLGDCKDCNLYVWKDCLWCTTKGKCKKKGRPHGKKKGHTHGKKKSKSKKKKGGKHGHSHGGH